VIQQTNLANCEFGEKSDSTDKFFDELSIIGIVNSSKRWFKESEIQYNIDLTNRDLADFQSTIILSAGIRF